MSENIEQFAIYSAKIFQLLYDSFPISRAISKDEVILEYLGFDEKELKQLKTKIDIASLAKYTDDEEFKLKVQTVLPKIEAKVNELEEAQYNDKKRQSLICEGTLEFLTSENFIRKYDNGRYQLTSKGFSHLNKVFKDGVITDDKEKTNISVLKKIFDKTSDISLQVAADTAVNVITKVLGYS